MANGLLSAIINPAQANVLGSLDAGRKRQAELAANDILSQTLSGKIGALAGLDSAKAAEVAKTLGIPITDAGRRDAMIGDAIFAAQLIGANQFQEASDIFGKKADLLEGLGMDASRSRQTQQGILSGDIEMMNNLVSFANSVDPTKQGRGRSAGQKERSDLLADLSSDDPIIAKSAGIALGLEPRAVGSAIQTISEKGTATTIAETEKIVTEGRETGKQVAQLKFKPQIAKAVALATKAASARGETMTDLARSEAALPGLLESVGQLKSLASVVTSTLGGKAFDFMVKESGFGATKGADARAKFVAIINNQVLPLLRQTFGAAFTEREGETLKATMGDPDSTPSQKILQLESFIDQKVRNIQASQRELGKEVTPADELIEPKFLGFE